jgi:hypothetical protein
MWGLLAAIGGFTAVTPYLAGAVGLDVDVAASVEVVDHVVPGLTVVGAAIAVLALGRRTGDAQVLGAAMVALLAGLWVTASHAPLLADAADGDVGWGAALLHVAAGPPLLALSALLAARAYRSAGRAES